MERSQTYTPPVDRLLTFGEERSKPDGWPDYLALGIGSEHIPDLIRMATDEELEEADEEGVLAWAPIHARRALGQLQAEAAIEPLFSLFTGVYESDWVTEELPEIFGMIGPAALPLLKTTIAHSATDEMVCIDAITCVEKIGIRWPSACPACIALLMEQLELFEINDAETNGFLVSVLVELQATEAAPLIERAFASRCVDLTIMGNWEDVQVKFGLKSAEEARRSRWKRHQRILDLSTVQELTNSQVLPKMKQKRETGQKKAQRKRVQQSRKRNRKR